MHASRPEQVPQVPPHPSSPHTFPVQSDVQGSVVVVVVVVVGRPLIAGVHKYLILNFSSVPLPN